MIWVMERMKTTTMRMTAFRMTMNVLPSSGTLTMLTEDGKEKGMIRQKVMIRSVSAIHSSIDSYAILHSIQIIHT
jgi:hypothetical protein